MSRTFTKLFSSITESTVWCEPDRTRLVWICMLAMADRYGRVWASVPGLANRSRVPIEDARKAIETFLSPDPDSRTPDNEGRRIAAIDGGWKLLNHEKYRDVRDEESILESKRKYINTRRAKERAEKSVDNVDKMSNSVDRRIPNAEADTEADAFISHSVSNETAAKAGILTPKEKIYAFGVPLLVKAGSTEKQARALFGKCIKSAGDDRVLAAIGQCIEKSPADPTAWLLGDLSVVGPPYPSVVGITVPGRAGKDPALLKIENDIAAAAPMPQEIRDRIEAMRRRVPQEEQEPSPPSEPRQPEQPATEPPPAQPGTSQPSHRPRS